MIEKAGNDDVIAASVDLIYISSCKRVVPVNK